MKRDWELVRKILAATEALDLSQVLRADEIQGVWEEAVDIIWLHICFANRRRTRAAKALACEIIAEVQS